MLWGVVRSTACGIDLGHTRDGEPVFGETIDSSLLPAGGKYLGRGSHTEGSKSGKISAHTAVLRTFILVYEKQKLFPAFSVTAAVFWFSCIPL